MQIVCPNCTTSYQIADAAVGAAGRTVRCARCQTTWHATQSAAAAPDEAGPEYDSVPVAAFQTELDAGPSPPLDEPHAAPSLDDLMVSEASEPAAGEPAPDWVEAPPLALSDIPIPIERLPRTAGVRRPRTRHGHRLAGRHRPSRHRERRCPPGSRCRAQTPQPSAHSAAGRDGGAASALRRVAGHAQGCRQTCAATGIAL